MSSPATSTKPTLSAPARPRRRRWLRVTIAVLALAIVGPLAFYVYSEFATRRALEDAESEAARDLPRWRLAELEADCKKIADEDNSALHIIAVLSKGKGVSVSAAPNYEAMFIKLPPTTQLNEQQLRAIRGELAKIVEPLAEARKLKDMRYGRFPIMFSDDFISTLIPDHQNARSLADWLKHDAFLHVQEERHGDAVDRCRACLNTSRSIGDEAFLITLLIRIAIGEVAIDSLERVVAQTKDPVEGDYEASLKEMQSLLELEAKECSYVRALRGERAGYDHLFENIRNGKISTNWLRNLGIRVGGGSFANPVSEICVNLFPTTLLKYYPDYLQYANEVVEAAKLPRHERTVKFAEFDAQKRASSNPLVQSLSLAHENVEKADNRYHVHLLTAAAAMACERYWLKHQRWPATLDTLVQDGLLARIPTDPFDNQPMRFRHTKEGVVIYSVGMDRKDDRGTIDPERTHMPGVDIGFRLWNPALRRQPPRPAVVIEENKERGPR